MAKFKIIKSSDNICWLGGFPIQCEKYNILYNESTGRNVLQLKLKNISEKKIKSVYLNIECSDTAKDPAGIVADVVYAGLSAAKGDTFGEKQAVETELSDIGYISIIVTKVVFENETVWRNDDNLCLKEVKTPESADAALNETELYMQYTKECKKLGVKTDHVITINDDMWLCSCGQPNVLSAEKCCFCGADKTKLIKISDRAYLQDELNKYNEEQEKIRLKQEEEARRKAEAEKAERERLAEEKARKRKKQIKLAAKAIATVCVVAVICFAANGIIKYNKYNAAKDLMAEGKYNEAYDAFATLKDYKDSHVLALNAKRETQNEISARVFHTVGLKSDGTVVAVGSNGHGQCDVENWKDIVAVSAGDFHTVGLKSDGTVVAVGDNQYGQCHVEDWSDIVAVSAGYHHSIGLKNDGTVVAVGDNGHGQCDVEDWSDIVAGSAGSYHTVGLKSDGTVVAVGYNEAGRCDVGDWSDIVAVSAGLYHTVGLKSDGTVVAVGSNIYGQCDVEDWSNIVVVSAGNYHTVGLKSDGTVVAVGNNQYGQCDVEDWSDIVAVSAGSYYTVGLKSDGTVVAVGNNKYSQCDVEDWSDIGK